MAHKEKRRKKTLPLLLAALTLAGAGLWWGNYTLSVEEYAFSSSRLPPGWDGGRLVVLSDLHGRQFGRDNRRLAAAVEAAHPDVIALVGDFVDEWTDPAYLRPLLERLTALAPCYFVSGNHEWAAGKMQETAALLADCGVTWLHNGFVTLQRGGDSLLLAGIDDPNGYADQKTPQQVAREVRDAAPEGFWLLLAHRNNRFDGGYCRFGADLTLCGHAHGGIWRLPGTDGLIDTHQQWFPSFTSGFYPCTDGGHPAAEVFVSRGLGNSPRWALRLFNRPQVAVITLEKDNAT